MKNEFGLWVNGARIYFSDWSYEIKNVSSFKRKVREILATDHARIILGEAILKKRVHVWIGKWHEGQKIIECWTAFSKIPRNFLDEGGYCYMISII